MAVPSFPVRVLLLALALPVMGASAPPPEFYIDQGACPFECCTYGTWRAKSDTPLLAEPKAGSKQVASVPKGVSVRALTGEVQTVPGLLTVVRDTSSYKAGEVLWVYTYIGEGYYKIWRDGQMIDEDLVKGPLKHHVHDWAKWQRLPRSQWWAKIAMKDGTVGWTNKPDNFRRANPCG